MSKRKEPAFMPGYKFYTKLAMPEGKGSWMFGLRVLEYESGKYVCKIENCIIEPVYINPGRYARQMIGKKIKLRKSEIVRGTSKTPILF